MAVEGTLREGTHAGYRWAVVDSGLGFRCGYVLVPPGHPWYGVDRTEIDAVVHGTVTWSGGLEGSEWWHVGFDCGHAFDLPDPDLPVDPLTGYLNEQTRQAFASHLLAGMATVRDNEFAEGQCRRLCEQAAAAVLAAKGVVDDGG